MNTSKISIITINYNNKLGLNKTIKSVISQTYKNIEYIVIDGFSIDDSQSVLEAYKLDIDIAVCESDSGVYEAMNKGIKRASGDYLLFLNSGDYFSDEFALYNFLNHVEFKGDIVYGDYKFEKGEKRYPDYLTPLFFVKSSLPHQSTLFSKRVFEKMGGYDESYKISADRDFYFKCFLSGFFVFKHVPIALSYFDLTGISNNIEFNNIKILEDEKLFRRNLGVFYTNYKQMLVLQDEFNEIKKQTLRGVLKRIKDKIFIICRIR
ncbi:glycosyltransferase family 2 protein [Winogradskyella wichelsiae]|uniref:glycosyltransferase family 2 protein n=1 Tax=Winogradskyella wichelsiae TaxID=2697007 RepID=UPI0015C6A595|nr:glycosyltransferase family 2 protein [Winogradskyella wichelsiae]